jgi:hypothetical protein
LAYVKLFATQIYTSLPKNLAHFDEVCSGLSHVDHVNQPLEVKLSAGKLTRGIIDYSKLTRGRTNDYKCGHVASVYCVMLVWTRCASLYQRGRASGKSSF